MARQERKEGERERERERERREREIERNVRDARSPCERHLKEVERDRDKGSFSTFTRTNFAASRFILD
jgi:hypothetical protein